MTISPATEADMKIVAILERVILERKLLRFIVFLWLLAVIYLEYAAFPPEYFVAIHGDPDTASSVALCVGLTLFSVGVMLPFFYLPPAPPSE